MSVRLDAKIDDSCKIVKDGGRARSGKSRGEICPGFRCMVSNMSADRVGDFQGDDADGLIILIVPVVLLLVMGSSFFSCRERNGRKSLSGWLFCCSCSCSLRIPSSRKIPWMFLVSCPSGKQDLAFSILCISFQAFLS